ncbi:unnamed protein product [Protopolystoma xenopodis]|uniref:Uncharacterized protein n=1 Tax=Protopolystoma xenopodis TaxID=117903 RepID=A0A448WEG9_9PLAT|nr:unnamed protein product [Protopolystoma xenopodis]
MVPVILPPPTHGVCIQKACRAGDQTKCTVESVEELMKKTEDLIRCHKEVDHRHMTCVDMPVIKEDPKREARSRH